MDFRSQSTSVGKSQCNKSVVESRSMLLEVFTNSAFQAQRPSLHNCAASK